MLQRRFPLLLALFMVAALVLTAVAIILLNQANAEDCLSQRATCDATVNALLETADPSVAPALLEEKACLACHNLPELAPPLTIARAFAPSRRPPLSAATYLYEAIVFPNAFILEGYNPTMPITPLEPAEIGALIAYLLNDGN